MNRQLGRPHDCSEIPLCNGMCMNVIKISNVRGLLLGILVPVYKYGFLRQFYFLYMTVLSLNCLVTEESHVYPSHCSSRSFDPSLISNMEVKDTLNNLWHEFI